MTGVLFPSSNIVKTRFWSLDNSELLVAESSAQSILCRPIRLTPFKSALLISDPVFVAPNLRVHEAISSLSICVPRESS
jgi:hypothetical protein